MQRLPHRSSDKIAAAVVPLPPTTPVNPPPAQAAASSNPHSHQPPTRRPAGSFLGGFRTPAPRARANVRPRRHPKPFTIADPRRSRPPLAILTASAQISPIVLRFRLTCSAPRAHSTEPMAQVSSLVRSILGGHSLSEKCLPHKTLFRTQASAGLNVVIRSSMMELYAEFLGSPAPTKSCA